MLVPRAVSLLPTQAPCGDNHSRTPTPQGCSLCQITWPLTPAIRPVFSLEAVVVVCPGEAGRGLEVLEEKSHSKKITFSQEPQGQQGRE